MKTTSPVPTMKSAGALLNSGKTREALHAFYDVYIQQTWQGRKPTPEVLQMIGVCCRMLRYYQRAEAAFEEALALAETDKQRGKILRDWAMVPLAKKDFLRALDMLFNSQRLLHRYPRERAATLGYIGRVYGKQGRRRKARGYHHMADQIFLSLRKTGEAAATYELNNLVWWLKVESRPRLRLYLTRRAWRLATAAHNRKRQLQITALLFIVHIFNRERTR